MTLFFYMYLSNRPLQLSPDIFFLKKMTQLIMIFSAGVIERHRAWEMKITPDEMRRFRAQQWLHQGYIPRSNTVFHPTQRTFKFIHAAYKRREKKKNTSEKFQYKKVALANVTNTLLGQEQAYLRSLTKGLI